MSNIVREDRDALNAVLTITIAREDYEPDFTNALKEQRKKAHLKGFRQGKAPIGTIRKMMGDRILLNLVNQRLSEELNQYLESEQLPVLGRPIMNEDQDQLEITAKDLMDYEFKFDVGLAPDFEIQGMPGDRTFELCKVAVADEQIDEELERIRKAEGTSIEVEGHPQEGDSLRVVAKELDSEGQPKAEGVENEFTLLFNNLSASVREAVGNKKAGDQLQVNIYELEAETNPEMVRKYLLGLEEEQAPENDQFELSIQSINRVEPAELSPELFEKTLGEALESEAEAREWLQERMSANFNKQGEALLFREIQDHLLAENQFDLPDTFLQRWLASENEDFDPSQYPKFAEGLRWTLIRNKLSAEHELNVSGEEIQAAARNRLMNQFGNQPWLTEEMIGGVIQRMLSDEQEIDRLRDEVLMEKLFPVLRDQMNTEEAYLSMEEMNEKIQEANQRFRDEEE